QGACTVSGCTPRADTRAFRAAARLHHFEGRHHRGRVALTSGADFATVGAGFVRVNLANSPDLISEAVRRMVTAL
ncbi:hypothetical protein ACFVG4_47060, partial [Streptomyces chartreusis]